MLMLSAQSGQWVLVVVLLDTQPLKFSFWDSDMWLCKSNAFSLKMLPHPIPCPQSSQIFHTFFCWFKDFPAAQPPFWVYSRTTKWHQMFLPSHEVLLSSTVETVEFSCHEAYGDLQSDLTLIFVFVVRWHWDSNKYWNKPQTSGCCKKRTRGLCQNRTHPWGISQNVWETFRSYWHSCEQGKYFSLIFTLKFYGFGNIRWYFW